MGITTGSPIISLRANGQITPSPAGISLSYSTNGVSSTQYTAILSSITNNKPLPLGVPPGSSPGASTSESTLSGNGTPKRHGIGCSGGPFTWSNCRRRPRYRPGGSYTVTLNLGTVGEQKSQALIKGFQRSHLQVEIQRVATKASSRNVPDGEKQQNRPTVVIKRPHAILLWIRHPRIPDIPRKECSDEQRVLDTLHTRGQPPTSPSQVVLITLLPYVETGRCRGFAERVGGHVRATLQRFAEQRRGDTGVLLLAPELGHRVLCVCRRMEPDHVHL